MSEETKNLGLLACLIWQKERQKENLIILHKQHRENTNKKENLFMLKHDVKYVQTSHEYTQAGN